MTTNRFTASRPVDISAKSSATNTETTCYLPLSEESQCGGGNALFIKVDQPAEVLFEAAESRQIAILELLKALAGSKISETDGPALSALARASLLLVSDAQCLYTAAQHAAKQIPSETP